MNIHVEIQVLLVLPPIMGKKGKTFTPTVLTLFNPLLV